MATRAERRIKAREREIVKEKFRVQLRENKLAQTGIHDFSLVLDNLKPDYNVGKIFRSAEAFGVHDIHLIGLDFFDPRPAVGSFKWVPAHFHESFAKAHSTLVSQGYEIVALEPQAEELLPEYSLPKKTAFVLGHEEFGLSFAKEDFPTTKRLALPQWGKVESLNVAVAASLAMYEWIRQHGKRDLVRTCPPKQRS